MKAFKEVDETVEELKLAVREAKLNLEEELAAVGNNIN